MAARLSTSSAPATIPSFVPQGRHKGKPVMTLTRAFTLIGSRQRAHLHLLSETVSKCHAAVINSGRDVYIRDLASRTHVLVNGRQVGEAALRDGDLVEIGSFSFKFIDGATPLLDRPQSAPAAALEVDGATEPLALHGRTTVIGRRPTCDVSLLEASVSTVHALIFETEGKHIIRDLGTRTGTFINGQPIHQHELHPGDCIRIGQTEFRYVAAEGDGDLEELEDLVGTATLCDEPGEVEMSPAQLADLQQEAEQIARPGAPRSFRAEQQPLDKLESSATHPVEPEGAQPIAVEPDLDLMAVEPISAEPSAEDVNGALPGGEPADAEAADAEPSAADADLDLVPLADEVAAPGVQTAPGAEAASVPPATAPDVDAMDLNVDLDFDALDETAVLPPPSPDLLPTLSAQISDELPPAEPMDDDALAPVDAEVSSDAELPIDATAAGVSHFVVDESPDQMLPPHPVASEVAPGEPVPVAAAPLPVEMDERDYPSEPTVSDEMDAAPVEGAFDADAFSAEIGLSPELIGFRPASTDAAPATPDEAQSADDRADAGAIPADSDLGLDFFDDLIAANEGIPDTSPAAPKADTHTAATGQTPPSDQSSAPGEASPSDESWSSDESSAVEQSIAHQEIADQNVAEQQALEPRVVEQQAIEQQAIEQQAIEQQAVEPEVAALSAKASEPAPAHQAPPSEVAPIDLSLLDPEVRDPDLLNIDLPEMQSLGEALVADGEFYGESTLDEPSPTTSWESVDVTGVTPPPSSEQVHSEGATPAENLAASKPSALELPEDFFTELEGGVSHPDEPPADHPDFQSASQEMSASEPPAAPEKLISPGPIDPVHHGELVSGDAEAAIESEVDFEFDVSGDHAQPRETPPLPIAQLPAPADVPLESSPAQSDLPELDAPIEQFDAPMIMPEAPLASPEALAEPTAAIKPIASAEPMADVAPDAVVSNSVDVLLPTESNTSTSWQHNAPDFDALAAEMASAQLPSVASPSADIVAADQGQFFELDVPEIDSEAAAPTEGDATMLADGEGAAPAPAQVAGEAAASDQDDISSDKSDASSAEGTLAAPAESEGAAVEASPDQTPDLRRMDPFFGMQRDLGSFIGGMPLPLPELTRPRLPFGQTPVTFRDMANALPDAEPFIGSVDPSSIPREYQAPHQPRDTSAFPTAVDKHAPPSASDEFSASHGGEFAGLADAFAESPLAQDESSEDQVRDSESLDLLTSGGVNRSDGSVSGESVLADASNEEQVTEAWQDRDAVNLDDLMLDEAPASESGAASEMEAASEQDAPLDELDLDEMFGQHSEQITPATGDQGEKSEFIEPAAQHDIPGLIDSAHEQNDTGSSHAEQETALESFELEQQESEPGDFAESLEPAESASADADPSDDHAALEEAASLASDEPPVDGGPEMAGDVAAEPESRGPIAPPAARATSQPDSRVASAPAGTARRAVPPPARVQRPRPRGASTDFGDAAAMLGGASAFGGAMADPFGPLAAGGLSDSIPEIPVIPPSAPRPKSPNPAGKPPVRPPHRPVGNAPAGQRGGADSMRPPVRGGGPAPQRPVGAKPVAPTRPLSGSAAPKMPATGVPTRSATTSRFAPPAEGAHLPPTPDSVLPPPAFGESGVPAVAAPIPPSRSPSRRRLMRVLLILGVLVIAGLAVAAVMHFLRPQHVIQGEIHYRGLANLAPAPRDEFQHRRRAEMGTSDFRARARDLAAADGSASGFLGDDADAVTSYNQFVRSVTWNPRGDTLVVQRISSDPVTDKKRLSAILRVLYEKGYSMSEELAHVNAERGEVEKTLAEAAEKLTALDAQLKLEREQARLEPEQRAKVDDLHEKIDALTKQRDAAGDAVLTLQHDLDELIKGGSVAASTTQPAVAAAHPTTAPAGADIHPDDADPQLRDLLAQQKQCDDSLAQAKTARDAQAGEAKSAFDAAQKDFDAKVNAARAMADGNSALGTYLARLKTVQTSMRKLNDELVQQQKDDREFLDEMKTGLLELNAERLKQVWDGDNELKALQESLSVAEHRYNTALAAKLPEAVELKSQMAELSKRIEGRRGLLGSKDSYNPAVKKVQDFIDERLSRMDQSRARNDERVQAVLNLVNSPDLGNLPDDQKALALTMDQATKAWAAARAQYTRQLQAANASSDAVVQSLTVQAAAVAAKIDERRKQLEIAGPTSGAPEQAALTAVLIRKRSELGRQRKAHAAASAALDEAAMQLGAAEASANTARLAGFKLRNDSNERELWQQKKDQAVTRLTELNTRLSDAIEVEKPGDQAVTVAAMSDPRTMYLGGIGGACLVLMMLVLWGTRESMPSLAPLPPITPRPRRHRPMPRSGDLATSEAHQPLDRSPVDALSV